jgi:chaperone BCS1
MQKPGRVGMDLHSYRVRMGSGGVRTYSCASQTKTYAELGGHDSVFAKSQEIIKRLVEQARLVHQARDQGKVVVYTPSRQSWQRSAARPPRKLESIVLPRGVKEGVVKDVTEFFQAAEWYADRGIPHRRGYLLHGVPGSGETSCKVCPST